MADKIATYKQYLENQPNHLELISSLSCFVNAIREFKQGEVNLGVGDMLEYFELMKSGNFSLSNSYKVKSGEQGVELLTAHSAKGLEFDYVYVIRCDQATWHSRQGRSNIIGSPMNISALPDKDNQDDSLRLFYVALTRAKNRLILTKHERDKNGKEIEPMTCLQGVVDFESQPQIKGHLQTKIIDLRIKSGVFFRPIRVTEKDFFAPVLEDYKMSVTHLNNFLDVTGFDGQRKGPRYFKEINLLRFPQNKSPNGCYGTAMHEAVANIHRYYKAQGRLPTLDTVLESFSTSLYLQRMSKVQTEKFLRKGMVSLTKYYELNKHRFLKQAVLEYGFGNQNVILGQAALTGNIDKLVENRDRGTIQVTDFKTGKAQKSWFGQDQSAKIKMFRYQKQLEFYKLLVENSSRYKGMYQVDHGYLEFLDHKPEDENTTILELPLTNAQSFEELELIINIVWDKIINLDFPDTSHYPNELSGILMFIEDLKAGKI